MFRSYDGLALVRVGGIRDIGCHSTSMGVSFTIEGLPGRDASGWGRDIYAPDRRRRVEDSK